MSAIDALAVTLGSRQSELGRSQRRASEEAQRRLGALVDEAVADGKTVRVP